MSKPVDINLEALGGHNEKAWDALVKVAPNGHLMARTGFFRYHADRFEDASLFFFRGRRPLGVLPANRVGDTLWSHQGVSFGGLILHPRTHFSHVEAAVSALRDHLRAGGFKSFMYRPAPHPYQVFPREEDVFFLEQAGARRVDTKLHSMVLCGEPSALTAKTWNHTVRRSKESGVTVRAGLDADLPAVWGLVEQALERHGQNAVHTIDDIALLRSRFPDEVPILLAESGSGELLSGQVLLRSGRTLTLLYVGDALAGRELNAGTMLQDHVMNAPENAGFWFDLGQWCDTGSRQGSDSLLQYKEAAGGRLIQRHTWQLDL